MEEYLNAQTLGSVPSIERKGSKQVGLGLGGAMLVAEGAGEGLAAESVSSCFARAVKGRGPIGPRPPRQMARARLCLGTEVLGGEEGTPALLGGSLGTGCCCKQCPTLSGSTCGLEAAPVSSPWAVFPVPGAPLCRAPAPPCLHLPGPARPSCPPSSPLPLWQPPP